MSDVILIVKTPSPMRILRAWLFRERSVRAIARILIGTSVKAHHHTAHLEKLT